jgi:hypothetical protein
VLSQSPMRTTCTPESEVWLPCELRSPVPPRLRASAVRFCVPISCAPRPAFFLFLLQTKTLFESTQAWPLRHAWVALARRLGHPRATQSQTQSAEGRSLLKTRGVKDRRASNRHCFRCKARNLKHQFQFEAAGRNPEQSRRGRTQIVSLPCHAKS